MKTKKIQYACLVLIIFFTFFNCSNSGTAEQVTEQVNQKKVHVVVAGYFTHGPMQPTIRVIKKVISKFKKNDVSVQWVNLNTSKGKDYFKEKKLTAHLNIIINDKITYRVNNKTVTFQMFEGSSWKKNELESVINKLIKAN